MAINSKRIKKLILIISFFSFSFTLYLFGEEKILYLGITDAVNLGLSRNLDVKREKNSEEKLEFQYKVARTNLYPNISGNITYQNYLYMPDFMENSTTDYEKSIAISLRQLVYSFGKVSHAINLAKELKDVQSLSKIKTQIDSSYEIKIAYLDVLYTKKLVEITKESLENAKRNKAIIVSSFSNGRLNQQDNIKMNRDIATRIPPIKEAEINYVLAENKLKRLLFMDDNEKMILTDDLTINIRKINLDQLINQMYLTEPNIQILNKTIKVKEETANINKSNKYPTINAFASFSPFSNTDKATIEFDKFHNLSIVGLSMTFPIFENGKYEKEYKTYLLDVENTNLQLKDLKLDLKLELENEVYRYSSLIDIYKSYEEAFELAKESFKLYQERFKFGKIGLLDLNDAELILTQAKHNLFNSIYQINLSLMKIEKLISKKEF